MPVIGLNRGAVPEVVRSGVTGFVVDTLDQAVEAVDRIADIDPAACRRHAAENFDVPLMVERYLRAYHAVIEAEKGPAMQDEGPPVPPEIFTPAA
jgi:glycosyltransferase involved in cell wall biosynthesis